MDKGPHHPGDLCSAEYIAEGDSCGAGEAGEAGGQFKTMAIIGSYIAIDEGEAEGAGDDELYVADTVCLKPISPSGCEELDGRIQRFDTGGHYQGTVPDPEGRLRRRGTCGRWRVGRGGGCGLPFGRPRG